MAVSHRAGQMVGTAEWRTESVHVLPDTRTRGGLCLSWCGICHAMTATAWHMLSTGIRPHMVCFYAQLSGFANHPSGFAKHYDNIMLWSLHVRFLPEGTQPHALNGNSAVGEPCLLVLFETHIFCVVVLTRSLIFHRRSRWHFRWRLSSSACIGVQGRWQFCFRLSTARPQESTGCAFGDHAVPYLEGH